MRRLASDGSTGNEYGWAVSISGNYAVVGAYKKASAYVLYKDQGGTDNWGQVKKLAPTGAGDAFGFSVAISGDYVVVGDIDAGYNLTGAAFIFNRNEGGTNQWGQVKKITASDADEAKYFGYSVAIDGNYVVVGSYRDYGEKASPVLFAGAAYIYNKDYPSANNWGERKKIVSSDRTANDYFGTSVSISGDYVVVGATGETLDQGGGGSLTNAGAAYVFYRNQGTTNGWGELRKIVASDRTSNDYFGQSVSISGYYVTVGTKFKGAAYVFYKTQGGTTNWGQVNKLTPTGESMGGFGNSVSMTNAYIIAGAYSNKYDENGENEVSGAGAAYMFKKGSGGTGDWSQQRKLVASSRNESDKFGYAVSMTDQYTIIGANGVSNCIGCDTEGQAYVFKDVTQASAIQVTAVKSDQYTVSWSSGNGAARIVFMKQGSGDPEIPDDKTTYNASTVFGAGSQIGSSGWYCVYKSTGTNVTVTGLTPATNYRAVVYEYFGNTGAEYYFTFYNSSNLTDQVSGIVLSDVDIHVANSVITGTTTDMQYSLNSTDGTDGDWYDCLETSTSVTFSEGDVYIRQKSITSNYRLVATIPAAPDAPAFTIDYQNEKTNEQIPDTIEYNTDNNFSTANTDGTGSKITLTPGTDLYFRVKPTATTLPGAVQHLVVPERPVLSAYTIDYVNEQTVENVEATVEYSAQPDMTGAVTGSNEPIILTPGTDVYFRKKATASGFVSEIYHLVIPDRPPAVTNYTINYLNETTNENVISDHEYATSSSMTGTTAGSNMPVALEPGVDLYFRGKATESTFASETQHLVVPDRPAEPTFTINFEDETTTENVTTDIEYSENAEMTAVSYGVNLVIPVTPGVDIYFRVTGTTENFSGYIKHLNVPQRPESPVISLSDRNDPLAVFKKSADGTGDNVTVTDQIEYSVDGGINWEQITEFTEVDATGVKIIIARRMSKVNAFASLPTDNLDYQKPAATIVTVETCNGPADLVQVQSNTDNGHLFIVHEDETITNLTSLNTAVGSGKAAKAAVNAANTNIDINTDGILLGTYYAYAVNLVAEVSDQSNESVVIHPIPDIDLGEDVVECEGIDVTLDAGSGYASYSWTPGGATTRSIEVSEQGDYSVLVSDANGCLNADTISLIYSQPYQGEKICLITIDLLTGKNTIIWEKTPDKGIVSYRIHRQTGVLGVYEPIATVPYENLSIFTDTVADPEKRQWVYKLTVIDTCENESDILASPFHKPLFLQYVSADDGVNLEWEKYEVQGSEMEFLTYKIYRGTDSTTLQYLDEVSGDLRVYKDNDSEALQRKYYYRVAGVKAEACFPTSGKKTFMEEYGESFSNLEDNKVITSTTEFTGIRNLTIYPNPFKESATVSFSNPGHDQCRLILRDVTGKIRLIKENITGEEVLLYKGQLNPGLYHIEVAGKRIFRGMVVIE